MTWKFDATVAETFVDHARQHIPNYDAVIDKCVDVCRHLCTEDSAIIDVGCATGETLQRLYDVGFWNLYGVDSSKDMLAKAPTIAQYTHSEELPAGRYDAVLCNWTMHFMFNKITYLQSIYDNLNDNGFLILSEKTTVDPLHTHFYHKFKKKQGVSAQAIEEKARSLEGVMNIHNVEWYQHHLREAGFGKIDIIDASWCFTTFLCSK